MTGERSETNRNVEFIGVCTDCDKKTYRSRKVARRRGRQHLRGEHVHAYFCEWSQGWHVGHLPRWQMDPSWRERRTRNGQDKNGQDGEKEVG